MDINTAAKIAYGFVPGWEQQELVEREDYERSVVQEARDITAGDCPREPNREHLRVLLSWLDGEGKPRPPAPAIPATGNPF